jgi:hypothetical protein
MEKLWYGIAARYPNVDPNKATSVDGLAGALLAMKTSEAIAWLANNEVSVVAAAKGLEDLKQRFPRYRRDQHSSSSDEDGWHGQERRAA